MASRGDIRAGRAYIELLLKGGEKVVRGLRDASKHLKDFGSGVAKVGAVMTAAGTSIVTAMAVAVKSFADTGSAIADMSARTGASATSLQELGYAAQQTGASSEDLEKGIAKANKQVAEAASGNKAAAKSFSDIGLSVDALLKMSPEDRFEAIGKALNGIQNPAERTAAAMEIFGKSGNKLTPMFADLDALKKQFQELGASLDDSQVAAADRLGDAMDSLKMSIGGVVNQIGAALAGTVTEGATTVTRIAAATSRWIKENQSLVVTVAQVGAGVAAAGSIITAVGLAIIATGAVLSGLATIVGAVIAVIGGLASVVGFLLTPLGLVATAVAAVAWMQWADGAKRAASIVASVIGPVAGVVKDTVKGISDALMAGDIALAGKIAMAGLKTAFLAGIDGIATAVGGGLGDFIGKIGTQLITGDLEGVWATICAGIGNEWAKTWEGVVALTASAINTILDSLQTASSAIAGFILDTEKGASPLTGGVDMQSEQQRENKNNAGQIAANKSLLEQARKDFAAAEAGGGKMTNNRGIEQTSEGLKILIDSLEKRLKELGAGPIDVYDMAKKDAGQQIANNFQAPRTSLEQSYLDAQRKADKAAAEFRERTKGGAAGSGAEREKAQAELAELMRQAADARSKVEAAAKKKAEGGSGEETTVGSGATAKSQFSTTSTAAAAAFGQSLGAGAGPMAETAKNTAKTAKAAEEIAKNTAGQQIGGKGGVGGAGQPGAPADQPGPMTADEAKRRLQRNLAGQQQGLSKDELDAVNQEMTPEERERLANTNRRNLDRSRQALENAKRRAAEKREADTASVREQLGSAQRSYELGGPPSARVRSMIETKSAASGSSRSDPFDEDKLFKILADNNRQLIDAINAGSMFS